MTGVEHRVLRRFVITVVVVNLLLICSVWGASFAGRSTLLSSLRQGCERTSTRIHLLAGDATDRGRGGLAMRLLATIPASCARAYPDPGPFGVGR